MAEIEIIDAAPLVTRAAATVSPVGVYLARLAVGSRPAQAHAIRVLAEMAHPGADPLTLPWHLLDYQHTAALRTQLAERYAPATANRTLAALRGVLREAWRLGLMSADQLERACDVPPVRGKRLLKGRALTSSELRSLFTCCSDTPAGIRDAALLAVLYSGGLRRSEAAALNVADYNVRDSSLVIHAGKGNKARTVYLTDGAIEKLDLYLELLVCGYASSDTSPDAMFVRLRKGAGTLERGSRLTGQAVRYIVRSRCRQATVDVCSPHDFRRTMISDLLDDGVDISTVQQIAGHSNVSTTQKYDRRGERTQRAAARRLHVP